jgi:hypothetical protein
MLGRHAFILHEIVSMEENRRQGRPTKKHFADIGSVEPASCFNFTYVATRRKSSRK